MSVFRVYCALAGVLVAVAIAAAASAPAGAVPGSQTIQEPGVMVLRAPAGPDMSGPAAQPDPGLTEIELQTFDGEPFPPEGWRTFDNEALARRREETYTWGPADCDLPTTAANVFAAWSVGGGRLGADLLCSADYTEPVESWLVRDGIDASGFEGGLLVSFDIRFDVPTWVERSPSDPAYVPPPVRVCGSTATAGSYGCRGISAPAGSEGRWVTTGPNPVALTMTAGQERAAIAFIYTDAVPDDLYSGAMIDNVRIQGRSAAVAPSPTPIGQVPTETGIPPTAVPTAVPTTFTPRNGQRAFMPFAIRSHDLVDDSPGVVPTALPGRVDVTFGTNVDGTGRVENASDRFDFGIRRLCAKEAWFDLAPGTQVRWQWYQYSIDRKRFDEIPGDQLNSAEVAQTSQGFANQCIRYVSPAGDEVPVPSNRYKVAVFLRGEAIPMASGVAEVLPGSGPQPTAGPSPTPKPLPEGCSDPLINGDFEDGPGVGWVERTPSREPIIRDEQALNSTYAALFGRHLGFQESMISTVVLDTLPADQIESVELKFALAVVSDETVGDSQNDDVFGVGVANEALTIDLVGAISEETYPLSQWQGLTVDMTAAFTKRTDFDRVSLGFVTQQSPADATNFIVDNVVMEFCLKSGQRLQVPVGRGPAILGGGPIDVDLAAALAGGESGAVRAVPLADRPALPMGWRTSTR